MKAHPSISILLMFCALCFAFTTPEEGEDGPFLPSVSKKGFRGKIIYTVRYESKCPTVPSRTLQEKYGDTMTLYIQDGNYKMAFNGQFLKEIFYSGKENRRYYRVEGLDSLIWRNCSPGDHRFTKTVQRRNHCQLLNRSCDAYSIETSWSTTTYLYDRKLKLATRTGRRKNEDQFSMFLRKARAPYLKCVYDGPLYKETIMAVAIEETELEEEIFLSKTLPLMTSEL